MSTRPRARITYTTLPKGTPSREPEPVALVDERRTRRGDLWKLDDHLLLCGSSTDTVDVAHLLDSGTPGSPSVPDLLIADPPYSSGGFQEAGRGAGSIGRRDKTQKISNDRLSTRGYMALIREAVNLSQSPVLYVFTDWRQWVNLFDVVESSGYRIASQIVWDKGTPGLGRGWRAQHELIMFASRQTVAFDGSFGNVRAHPRTGNRLHPTEKPVKLLRELIKVTPGAIVYDPFAGAGTTLIAAHHEHRRALLMEQDREFCDVIVARWEAVTGGTARKITNKRSTP